MVNVAKIYSTLGNSSSLIPLAVKDISATAGMTAGSFVTGKEEAKATSHNLEIFSSSSTLSSAVSVKILSFSKILELC